MAISTRAGRPFGCTSSQFVDGTMRARFVLPVKHAPFALNWAGGSSRRPSCSATSRAIDERKVVKTIDSEAHRKGVGMRGAF